EVVQLALRETPHLPPEGVARLREDLRLQFDYADECVAFIDSWKRTPTGRQFVRRVVAHGKTWEALDEALATLPPREQAKVVRHYVSDPEPAELPVRHEILPD